MSMSTQLPEQYVSIRKQYKAFFKASENLGKAAASAGPLDPKTSHLVQLAAAAAIRSEGSVHSHTRRAIEAGASPDEIRHAILLIASTVGFPTMSAALSWANDIIEEKEV